MKKEFTASDIQKALGIPRERLRAWLIQGFLQTSRKSRGQGKTRLFTLSDVYAIALFERLLAMGANGAGVALLRCLRVVTETGLAVFPLIYEMEDNLTPIRHYYLGDPDEIARAAQAVADQAKGRK